MDLVHETDLLLAQRLIGVADTKHYVAWAMQALLGGYETESVVILAGMDNDTREDATKYFLAALGELNLAPNKDEDQLLLRYVLHLCAQVRAGTLIPYRASGAIQQVYYKTYSELYYQLASVEDEYETSHFAGDRIQDTPLEDVLRKEFSLFEQAAQLGFDARINTASWCNACQAIVQHAWTKEFTFMPPFYRYKDYVCGTCNQKTLELNSQRAREKIIQAIRQEKH